MTTQLREIQKQEQKHVGKTQTILTGLIFKQVSDSKSTSFLVGQRKHTSIEIIAKFKLQTIEPGHW